MSGSNFAREISLISAHVMGSIAIAFVRQARIAIHAAPQQR
jgi:hypothetical protein